MQAWPEARAREVGLVLLGKPGPCLKHMRRVTVKCVCVCGSLVNLDCALKCVRARQVPLAPLDSSPRAASLDCH